MNAPIQRPSFVRELCTAVAHRWQPRRIFVVLNLTTYLDESGTHDNSPVTVMGGVMATAEQWDRFEAAFCDLKARYGFRVFHTRKFKKRAGEFRNWHPLRRFALMQELAVLTSAPGTFIEAVTVTLDNADYKANYVGGDKPRRLRLESKYGLCFRNCLMFFLLEGMKWVHEGSPPKLHFILESGHPNWNEVRQIFNEVKAEVQGFGVDMLGEITFSDKNNCNPLMVADFLAHTAFLMGQRGEAPPNEVPFREPYQEQSLPPGEPAITHLRFAPGGLADLKNVLIEKLKAKSAWGQNRASKEQSS